MKNMEAEVKKLRRQGKEADTLEKEMNSLKAANEKKNRDPETSKISDRVYEAGGYPYDLWA